MNRPRAEINRRQHLYNPEFSPKIPAKKLNVRKRVLGGQQSAQQGRRPNRQLLSQEPQCNTPSQQQIRSSAIYRLLEQQMKLLMNRHNVQQNKLKQIKQEREKQLSSIHKDQHQTKLQIWELKNEVLDLKESIKEEKEEATRLMSQLGIEDSQIEGDSHIQS